MDKFKQLGIFEPILKSIKDLGFETPTEVQEKSIPSVIAGKDIIAGASTGSGKTLAFGAGIIQNSQNQGVIQSLVLVPTRELAEQVSQELKKFSSYHPLNIVEVYGGTSITRQIQKLRKADVVVATPGRLLDHLGQGTIELGYVNTLVLDEADRMLDMGFIIDVKKIISQCPEKRQTMLFSATLSSDIMHLSERYMKNPVKISCESKVDPSKLKQVYYDVEDNMKFSLLVHLLKSDKSGLVMVFCSTKRNTDIIAKNLQLQGINALAIHGGHTQDKRKRTMDQFHSNQIEVLVCTDVAARGIDVKGISHVYNYDIPRESNQYIHRIGRTARAGKEGKAVSILASRDYQDFDKLLTVEKVTIERLDVPQVERVFIDKRIRESRDSGNRRYGRSNDSRGGSSYGGRRERSSYGRGRPTPRSGGDSRFGNNRRPRSYNQDNDYESDSRDRRPRQGSNRFSNNSSRFGGRRKPSSSRRSRY